MVARIQKRAFAISTGRWLCWQSEWCAFGTLQIRNAQPTENFWVKQLIGLGIGIVVMLLIAFNDYRKLLNIAPAFYIFGLLLLVIVLVPAFSLRINGQRAWIKVSWHRTVSAVGVCKSNHGDDAGPLFWENRTGTLTLKEMAVGGFDTRAADHSHSA